MLKEWPYYALESAYYAPQESQVADYAPNYVAATLILVSITFNSLFDITCTLYS